MLARAEALAGRSYPEVGSCWELVRDVLAAGGVTLPEQEEALEREHALAGPIPPGQIPRAGDIVVMIGEEGVPLHVGVMLDPFRTLHATRAAGVVIHRLEALRRAGQVRRVVRLGSGEHRLPTGSESGNAAGNVRVTVLEDCLSGRPARTSGEAPAGQRARTLAGTLANGQAYVAAINGKALRDGEDPVLAEGDHLVVAPAAGEPTTIALTAIALVSALASGFIASRALSAPASSRDGEQQRYGFGRFSNDAFAGDVIPVVLGHRPRYGGKVVAAIPGEGVDGSGDEYLRLLICLGHGPFARIGNQTADFDRLAASALTGIFLNDQPIANFPGCFVSGRMGASTQPVMRGFDDTETLREVGVGGVALRNTSGSERTGGSASGEAYTFTTAAVNFVVPRIRFPRGLASLSDTGQLEPRRVKYRARTRVAAGPGSWSAWTVFSVEQARQSEFFSSPRLALTASTPAAYDVQLERVSVEAGDAASVDDLVWDSIVEGVDAENTYDGFAMLDLELKASEQLTGVPRVSASVDGYAALRIWDGVSDPSSPVFTTGYSANPADHALEMITNPVWGMGATWGDGNVNMASLLAFRASRAATVSRPGGGSRPAYACNLVIDEDRDGVEWLMTICRAGGARPALAGNQWRFILDDAQSTPVERFTDGSILVDEDGKAQFSYTREYTQEGLARANQVVCAFENEQLDGAPDTFVWPAAGDEWLASEPVVPENVRLDGVTDPDQVAAMVLIRAKQLRYVSRRIRLQTTRDVVVVQAGDRFDAAMSLPAWGLASGRVAEGSTASALRLDRGVTLASATSYSVQVLHVDGSVEIKTIAAAAGVYEAGEAIALGSDLAQAPAAGAEYALGRTGLEMKPFICDAVRLADPERLVWEIEGTEYAAGVYDGTAGPVVIPPYSELGGLTTAPGPVLDLRAYERVAAGVRQVSLAWRQAPEDAQRTASFYVFRRIVGGQTWIRVPEPKVAARGAVIEITDTDRAYEFAVVAVSLGGSYLSPDDPRVPKAILVFGLAALPPAAPTGLVATQVSGNRYKLTWDAVDGAVGYQVLYGGLDFFGYPNAGGESCLVLARTTDPELDGLDLAAGYDADFWVRSVGSSGRLSFDAATVTVSNPPPPVGETIKSETNFVLSDDGTPDNLEWNGDYLNLDNANAEGVWTSDEVDTGSTSLGELTMQPGLINDAADPAINTDPFSAPSIAADQWGIVDSSRTVAMLFPPWPDSVQSWTFEVQLYNAGTWGDWQTLSPCGSIRAVFSSYRIRVRMKRSAAPYRPGIRELTVIVTH